MNTMIKYIASYIHVVTLSFKIYLALIHSIMFILYPHITLYMVTMIMIIQVITVLVHTSDFTKLMPYKSL